jgi:23S rRNA pseudouridine1911/1915/1917 synthase
VTEPGHERFEWVVGASEAGTRLDHFLVGRGVLGTRSQIQQLIRAGCIMVGSRPVKPGTTLRAGQRVEVSRPAAMPTTVEPEPIPLAVLYEDDDLLAINKPAGLVVHPAPGHWHGTLVNALLHRWRGTREGMDLTRLGLVHRLDKDTSGVLLIAKNVATLAALAAQFKRREVRKEYLALAWGTFRPPIGVLSGPIGRHPVQRKRMAITARGRPAITRYAVVESFGDVDLVRLVPETGRTHQIRVHLAAAGHPIVADAQYGGTHARRPAPIQRQALHAESITVRHPRDGTTLRVTAPLAGDFEAALWALRARRASKNRA